ncbi:hypothetical protein GGR57DRAFT_511437 [Xylariaceae sp. FL1272]|nr:hypothetical protein GGR57DRAFT_511437 [Xylariaceae sp. FL1272]
MPPISLSELVVTGDPAAIVRREYFFFRAYYATVKDHFPNWWQRLDPSRRKDLVAMVLYTMDLSEDKGYNKQIHQELFSPQVATDNFVPDLLNYVFTTSLRDQCLPSQGGRIGDCAKIRNIYKNVPQHLYPNPSEKLYCVFVFSGPDDQYGVQVNQASSDTLEENKDAVRNGYCMYKTPALSLLQRQYRRLLLCSDICRAAQVVLPENKTQVLNQFKEKASGNVAEFEPAEDEKNIAAHFARLAKRQRDIQVTSTTETRPEHPKLMAGLTFAWAKTDVSSIQDKAGKTGTQELHEARRTSNAYVDLQFNILQARYTWLYIFNVLETLAETSKEGQRDIALLDLTNACYLELLRSTRILTRLFVNKVNCARATRDCLVRQNDNGIDMVHVFRVPPEMEETAPLSFFLLQLCKQSVGTDVALSWLDKISALGTITDEETYTVNDAVLQCIGSVSFIVRFMEALSRHVHMPEYKRAKSQRFRDGTRDIQKDLDKIKPSLNIVEFVYPFERLYTPGNDGRAVQALNDAIFAQRKVETLDILFSNVVDQCVNSLETRLQNWAQQEREREADEARKQSQFVPLPNRSPPRAASGPREDRETQPADDNNEPTAPPVGPPVNVAPPPPAPVIFKVNAAVFTTAKILYGHRTGSVRWADFETLMTAIGFSIERTTGSVVKFTAPPSLENDIRGINIHHPHPAPNMENWKRQNVARRLTRVFRIEEDSFQIEP